MLCGNSDSSNSSYVLFAPVSTKKCRWFTIHQDQREERFPKCWKGHVLRHAPPPQMRTRVSSCHENPDNPICCKAHG